MLSNDLKNNKILQISVAQLQKLLHVAYLKFFFVIPRNFNQWQKTTNQFITIPITSSTLIIVL